MPPKDTEIGRRLKAARQKSALTQESAAKKWKVSVKTLQAWEQGWNQPRGLALRALEEILKKAGV